MAFQWHVLDTRKSRQTAKCGHLRDKRVLHYQCILSEYIGTAHAECTQIDEERRQFYKHDFDEGILNARRNLQRPITPGGFKNKDLKPYPNPA